MIKEKLGTLTFWCICILILGLNLGLWYLNTHDYIEYKLHSNEYNLVRVKIIETKDFVGEDYKEATFNYYDNNQLKKGTVRSKFFDKKGDEIEIAFDQNMNYIRPCIFMPFTNLCLYILSAYFFVVVIKVCVEEVIKKND